VLAENCKSIPEYLKAIAEGNLDTDGYTLATHPEIKKAQNEFVQKMVNLKNSVLYCPCCKERNFEKTFKNSPDLLQCDECKKGIDDHGFSHFSADNDMDPFSKPSNAPFPNNKYPCDDHGPLPELTPTEEMMVAQVHPIMKCYRLSTGANGFQGNILNIEQDIQPLVSGIMSLPHYPIDLPIVIVQKPSHKIPGAYKEFKVRPSFIRRWLLFFKRFNPLYRNIIINEQLIDSFESLPDGSIASLLTIVEEQDVAISQHVDQQLQAAQNAVAARQQQQHQNNNNNNNNNNSDSNHADDNDEDDDDMPEDQQQQGPFQNGAAGIPLEERQVEESYIGRPVQKNQQDEASLLKFLRQATGGGCLPPTFNWPAPGAMVNDYNYASLQAKAFPTLFPYGHGDVTKKDR
jgi:hypothetical protein